jgi:hypothetical protein
MPVTIYLGLLPPQQFYVRSCFGDHPEDQVTPATDADAEESSDLLCGVLLVDAKNGLNELSRKAMLWTTRHLWANRSRFAFYCYCHSSQLILWRWGKPCDVLLSQEGVTQGSPLSMVLYGLTLTPLAALLQKAAPSAVQPWYANKEPWPAGWS